MRLRVIVKYIGTNLNGEEELRFDDIFINDKKAPKTTTEYNELRRHIRNEYGWMINTLIVSWHELEDD